MAVLRCVFIFVSCCLFVNCEVNTENTSNKVETHSTEIAAVLNYLNSAPVKVYNYKKGNLINAHTKADISELTLHVSVDCINNYPDLPCSEKVLVCNAFVRTDQVLGDVKCQPKPEIIIDEPPYVTNPEEVEANENRSIALSNEAVSSEVGEHFVAIRRDSVPCLGCPFDLNPEAEGVQELINTALRHVETEKNNKQALVKVLKLQQQVVSGVKYIILIEIAPTVCLKETSDQEGCPVDETADTSVCQITYLQKPWISKAKHIISNNCTVSQEFVQHDGKKDINNEIDVNSGPTKPALVDSPNFDQIAESGAVDDLTARFADLESQIVVEPEVTNQPNRIIDEFIVPSTAPSEFSAIGNQPLEDKPTLQNTDSSQTEAETTPLANEQQVANDFVSAYYGSVDSADFPQNLKNETEASEESRPKRAVPQLEKITSEEKGLVKNLADFAASTLDNMDDDNHKRVILQILGAKKMVGDDGVYYRLIMRMGVSQCLEDKPPNPNEDCREKLFENYTKICKVQVFVNDDFGSPKVVKSQCQNIKRDENDSNRTNYSRFRRDVLVGGQSSVNKDSETIRQLVHEGVTQLNSQWDDNKHKPVEVVSATSQIVAGVMYRVKVKLGPTDCSNNDALDYEQCRLQKGVPPKVCTLKIWEKSWMDFRQFTVTCEGDQKVYKFGSESRVKRTMPGGQFEVAKDDETVVQYLEDSLQHLDSATPFENKLKVHEIISATQQIVAGRIYRIKAKVVESNCKKIETVYRGECGNREAALPKVCSFEIWDRLWIPNSRETNITCDGDDKEYFFKGNPHRRLTRQIAGGLTETSQNNKYVVQYLEEALQHWDSVTPHDNKLKVQQVVSVNEQIVAGTLYRIKAKIVQADCAKTSETARGDCGNLQGAQTKTCDFKIWDRPWIPNSRQTNITCEGDEFHSFQGEPHSRKARQVAGGISETSKENQYVVQYLDEALQHLDTVSPHENKLKVQEVVSVNQQVVAGMLYRIKAKVIQADCVKNSATARGDCGNLEGAQPKICDFKIWDRPWIPNSRQTNVTCEGDEFHSFQGEPHHRVARQILGGETETSKDNTEILQYLDESLQHLDTVTPHDNKLKVQEVVSASQQVVAGFLYRISAKVVQADCKKTSDTARGECGALQGAKPKTCTFKIWDRSWIPNSRQTNITCDGNEVYTFKGAPGEQRPKRSPDNFEGPRLLGGDDIKSHFLMFNDFVRRFNRTYSSKREYKYRLKVFSENMQFVRVLNTYEQGTAKYGATRFGDLTRNEFSKSLGYRPDLRNENEVPFAKAEIPDVELPTEFDWREKGAVTEVKDQQQCGSCWAFSVTGNVEGQYAIKHEKLMEFSEQELVDCDTDDQGCNGGLMDTAYRTIEKMGGLETEQDYPYDAEDEKCHFNRTLARVQLTGAVNISHDETEMAKWLVANGPISIAINANAMQFYMGGVSHPFKFLCSPNSLDHGVLIVGYGVHTYPLFKKSLPYWIVKNSWGKSWGEQGYYRVYRGDGTCGLNQTPSSAIVA